MKPVVALLLLLVLNISAWAGEEDAIALDRPIATPINKAHPTFSISTDAITIPRLISYQGKLTDTLGVPVPDGNYSLTFRLYTQETGGTPFWSEAQTVPVRNGIFSVLLGAAIPIPQVPDAGDLYLSMQVGAGSELTPRLRIGSVPYAYLAERAGNADALQGRDTTYFATATHTHPYVDSARISANTYQIEGNNLTTLDARWINEGQANAITSAMIQDNTILRADVATNFKAPYSDTADYARTAPAVDSARIAANSYRWNNNLWGAVDYPRADRADTALYVAGANVVGEVAYANWADTATTVTGTITFADSARIAANSHKLQGKDTLALSSKFVDEGQTAGGDLTGTYPNPTIASNAITSAQIQDGTIAAADLSQMGAASGQVLKWTGSAWAPANDSVGQGDDAWVRGTPDSVLYTIRYLGIARGGASNYLYGNYRYTHTNLGNASTTGTNGEDKSYCTVSGGYNNSASNDYSTVAGGLTNTASGAYAAVVGGNGNVAADTYAIVAGGRLNTANEFSATVGGGYRNTASGRYATVAGGEADSATAEHATVGGGYYNRATQAGATVAGGNTNRASGVFATVGGGFTNTASNTYALVGGGYYNSASGYAATVAGGYSNTASGINATVSGGLSNVASDTCALVAGGYGNSADRYAATVSGGTNNKASGRYATVSGGGYDSATADYATVAGGYYNKANGRFATVCGGNNNLASDSFAIVGGGAQNTASRYGSTVGGGTFNFASGRLTTIGGGGYDSATAEYATVGGGYANTASGRYATIGGGRRNTARDTYAIIGGGYYNDAFEYAATIGGGYDNTASGRYSTVGGGSINIASGEYATVGGGRSNSAETSYATVAGGLNNEASNEAATVGGGGGNTASGYGATIAGGAYNIVSGRYATVPGGYYNNATEYCSFAAGTYARANHTNSFVWADSAITPLDSVYTTGPNQFRVRARGGVWFFSNRAMTSGVYLASGSNSWASACDRANKTDFQPVDHKALLKKLATVPVHYYRMKDQHDGTKHIGPVAQDFYAAFGVGENDKSINMADADGVLFAAIQALYQENQELRQELELLKAKLNNRGR